MICFINKTKFRGLLGTHYAISLGYENSNPEQLMYINENWKIELGPVNQERAEKSAYILVSDDFPLEKYYKPVYMIEFLVHSGTDRKKRIEPFETIFPYFNVKEEQETKGSEYEQIAKNIFSNNQPLK